MKTAEEILAMLKAQPRDYTQNRDSIIREMEEGPEPKRMKTLVDMLAQMIKDQREVRG